MSVPAPRYRIDKQQIAQSFGRAARHYDAHADLQRQVAQGLARHLPVLPAAEAVLDLGAGTGFCGPLLRQHYPTAGIFALDIAEPMLRQARASQPGLDVLHICGDAEALPLADASLDLLFSSLTIQWCQHYPSLFREVRRVLRPGGLALFSTFGPDTLKELRAAWARVDDAVHVNAFRSGEGLLHAAREAGFRESRLEVQMQQRHYGSLAELSGELKGVGAHNMNTGQPKGLTGRRRLLQLKQAFEGGYRQADAPGIPVTYEVYHLILRA